MAAAAHVHQRAMSRHCDEAQKRAKVCCLCIRISFVSTPAQHWMARTALGRRSQEFPIGEEKLIELAKELHETGTGVKDDSLLAPDFRWLQAFALTLCLAR